MEIAIGIAGLIVGLVGAIGGIWGAFVAYKQKFLADQLKATLDEMKKRREREIWTQIGIDLTVFDALEKAKGFLAQEPETSNGVRRKVESARRATIDLYRLLLNEAVAVEPSFTMETIQKWRRAGRLENEWRVRAAMRLLPTSEVPNDDPIALSLPEQNLAQTSREKKL